MKHDLDFCEFLTGNRHLVCSGGMWMKEMAMGLDEEFKDQGQSLSVLCFNCVKAH